MADGQRSDLPWKIQRAIGQTVDVESDLVASDSVLDRLVLLARKSYSGLPMDEQYM